MRQKILFVQPLFFERCGKIKHQNLEAQQSERISKRAFLKQILDSDIELIQLPCPEFLLYGSNRWGHAVSQFDTPFFRKETERMLESFVMQIEEYLSSPERFELLGIVGIDGSPSCGVHSTYDGDWGGELTGIPDLTESIQTLKKVRHSGIFMEVFQKLLEERCLNVPFFSIETFSISTKFKKLWRDNYIPSTITHFSTFFVYANPTHNITGNTIAAKVPICKLSEK